MVAMGPDILKWCSSILPSAPPFIQKLKTTSQQRQLLHVSSQVRSHSGALDMNQLVPECCHNTGIYCLRCSNGPCNRTHRMRKMTTWTSSNGGGVTILTPSCSRLRKRSDYQPAVQANRRLSSVSTDAVHKLIVKGTH